MATVLDSAVLIGHRETSCEIGWSSWLLCLSLRCAGLGSQQYIGCFGNWTWVPPWWRLHLTRVICASSRLSCYLFVPLNRLFLFVFFLARPWSWCRSRCVLRFFMRSATSWACSGTAHWAVLSLQPMHDALGCNFMACITHFLRGTRTNHF